MKTLITLLMLSMVAPTAFAQSNCARIQAQEKKITQVSAKIQAQQAVIDGILKSIETKNYHISGSTVVITLGSVATVGGLGYSTFFSVLGGKFRANDYKFAIVAGVISGVSGYYLYLEKRELNELNVSLERKQAELKKQENSLAGAQANVELLKTMFPNCN